MLGSFRLAYDCGTHRLYHMTRNGFAFVSRRKFRARFGGCFPASQRSRDLRGVLWSARASLWFAHFRNMLWFTRYSARLLCVGRDVCEQAVGVVVFHVCAIRLAILQILKSVVVFDVVFVMNYLASD